MSAELPAPLVAPDVDLRGMPWMPYFGDLLRDSDFNSRATDAEFRAAHNLWWACWHQVPASSLPDDDVILCRLADLGRDRKTFQKVKSFALHGFVKCSDDRFYHKMLAPQAIAAWERRVYERDRKKGWRESKGKIGDVDGDNGYLSPSNDGQPTVADQGRDGQVPGKSSGHSGQIALTGQDRTVEEDALHSSIKDSNTAQASAPARGTGTPDPEIVAFGADMLAAAGVKPASYHGDWKPLEVLLQFYKSEAIVEAAVKIRRRPGQKAITGNSVLYLAKAIDATFAEGAGVGPIDWDASLGATAEPLPAKAAAAEVKPTNGTPVNGAGANGTAVGGVNWEGDDLRWARFVERFKTTGLWLASAESPKPGAQGCVAPRRVLTAYGFDLHKDDLVEWERRRAAKAGAPT